MSGPPEPDRGFERSNPIGALARWQKRRVQELLKTEISGDLSIPRLAAECGLSTSHFAAAFKKSFRASVHKKVVSVRIMRAQALLLNVDIPLAEVALQVGFSDQTSFTRTFRIATGASPGRWRKLQMSRKT